MDGHAARRLGAGRTNLLVRLAVIVLLIVAIVIVVGQLRKLLHPQTTQQGPETLKAGYVIRPFSARDLNGQTVDNSFFAKQRFTMVNVWGTFCGPCIREMPDLAQLPAEFRSSDFAILGVIADTPDADNEITARQLVSTAGATYTNVIPDRGDAGRRHGRAYDVLRGPHRHRRRHGADGIALQGPMDNRHQERPGESAHNNVVQ
jgi:thiol-disulfide isomerase/thioredoxin